MVQFSDAIGGKTRVIGGPFGSNLTQKDYSENGVPVIRGGNMGSNGRDIEGPFVYVSHQKFAKNLTTNTAKPGDIIVTQRGTLGQVSVLQDNAPYPNYVVSQSQMAVRVDRSCADRDFVYYYLTSPIFNDYVASVTIQTGVPHINLGILRDVEVDWPPLSEQRAIAATLGALDDKIELNRRMCETLESMARAVFRDWFVDFGPTRAKMAGTAPYLAEDLWSLFPDRLDDQGKPEGWENGNLGRIAQSKNRGVSPADVHQDTPYIGLEHMPRGSIALNEWEGAGKVTSNKSSFEAGDFLFGKLRPYFHKVGIAPVAGICSTDIVVVGPRTPAWHAFVIACISDEDFVAYTDKTATGTKMPRTSWPVMAKYKLMIPSDALAQCFNSIVAPKLEKIRAIIAESRTLAETRDLLLPRLMSGELRVADAEPLLEKVL